MKVLILGGSGMLGHKLLQVLQKKFEVYATVRGNFARYEKYGIFQKERLFEETDAENIPKISKIVEQLKPAYLINCVGIIKQLPSARNAVKTIRINALLPHQLAEIAEESGAKLITVSTDCVFRGEKGMYTEEDISDAEDLYGKSKYLGEVSGGRHLTLRSSIIGRELSGAHSLIEWFLSNRDKKIKGFAKAVYTGFPTIVFADIIAGLMLNQPDLKGLYHVSSEKINKYELLMLAKKYYRIDVEIEKDEDFEIDRSLDSGRFRAATGFQSESWDAMIRKMAEDETPYEDWR